MACPEPFSKCAKAGRVGLWCCAKDSPPLSMGRRDVVDVSIKDFFRWTQHYFAKLSPAFSLSPQMLRICPCNANVLKPARGRSTLISLARSGFSGEQLWGSLLGCGRAPGNQHLQGLALVMHLPKSAFPCTQVTSGSTAQLSVTPSICKWGRI